MGQAKQRGTLEQRAKIAQENAENNQTFSFDEIREIFESNDAALIEESRKHQNVLFIDSSLGYNRYFLNGKRLSDEQYKAIVFAKKRKKLVDRLNVDNLTKDQHQFLLDLYTKVLIHGDLTGSVNNVHATYRRIAFYLYPTNKNIG